MATISKDDPVATAAVDAIHTGQVAALRRLLVANPELVSARLRDTANDATVCTRTLLHVVADWPGHFPHERGITDRSESCGPRQVRLEDPRPVRSAGLPLVVGVSTVKTSDSYALTPSV